MAEASDFKFGTELGFIKSNYKTTPKDKSGEIPKIWGFPLIFIQWLNLTVSNLVHSVVCQIGPS